MPNCYFIVLDKSLDATRLIKSTWETERDRPVKPKWHKGPKFFTVYCLAASAVDALTIARGLAKILDWGEAKEQFVN